MKKLFSLEFKTNNNLKFSPFSKCVTQLLNQNSRPDEREPQQQVNKNLKTKHET